MSNTLSLSPAIADELRKQFLNDRVSVTQHIRKEWQPEEISTLCYVLLGINVPELQDSLTRCTDTLLVERERIERIRGKIIDDENTIIYLRDSWKATTEELLIKEDAVKSLTASNQSLRETIADLNTVLEKRHVPEEIRELADYFSGIVPDRKCKVSPCNGKRGWYGFTVVVRPDGAREITPKLCCGKVGHSEYARILAAIRNLTSMQQDSLAMQASVFTFLPWWKIWQFKKRFKERFFGRQNEKHVDVPSGTGPASIAKESKGEENISEALAVSGQQAI